MDQSPTQTPENQESEQGSECRNGRLLNTEGPKCEKPAQKNVHRWGNCVLPADHAGFCYYRDSDGEARQANYGTAENPARCSDAMDRVGRLQHLRHMAYMALRLHWEHEEAARMVKEAGDSESALNKLIGKIPKHLPTPTPESIEAALDRLTDKQTVTSELAKMRRNAFYNLRASWGSPKALEMIEAAGDDHIALRQLIGKRPETVAYEKELLYEQPLVTNGQHGTYEAIPQIATVDPSSKNVLTHMGEISRAVDKLIAQRDEALKRCSQLELANAALRKAAGL